MTWTIEFDPDAEKELASLDKSISRKIVRYLTERIATDEDPRRFGTALTGQLAGLWRALKQATALLNSRKIRVCSRI